jgi:hypothetical protein
MRRFGNRKTSLQPKRQNDSTGKRRSVLGLCNAILDSFSQTVLIKPVGLKSGTIARRPKRGQRANRNDDAEHKREEARFQTNRHPAPLILRLREKQGSTAEKTFTTIRKVHLCQGIKGCWTNVKTHSRSSLFTCSRQKSLLKLDYQARVGRDIVHA